MFQRVFCQCPLFPLIMNPARPPSCSWGKRLEESWPLPHSQLKNLSNIYSTPWLLRRRASLIIWQGNLVIVPWTNNGLRVQDKGGHLYEGWVDLGPILHFTSVIRIMSNLYWDLHTRVQSSSHLSSWVERGLLRRKNRFLGELMSVVSIPSKSKMGNNWTSSELLK